MIKTEYEKEEEKETKEFYIVLKDNCSPYLKYYLTHDIFYTNYDITDALQDACIFTSDHLQEVTDFLKNYAKEYNYKYQIEYLEA